ncbi:MAG: hypothetical protein PIR02_01610 [Microbacterium enclense]
MIDCLPATGSEPLLPLGAGILILLLGLALVMRPRRRVRRPGRSTPPAAGGAATLSIALLLAMSVGLGTLGGAAPAARADTRCDTTPIATTTPVPTPEPAAILPDQPVSFDSGGVTFSGSYRGPVDPTHAVAAAVIIGGTGAIDRDGNTATLATEDYSWLADLLSSEGIASLRYDKLGTGQTGLGPYTSDPSAMLALDYDQLRIRPGRDALSFLATQPGIDTNRLILVGHSEGGAAALTIAADLAGAPAPAGLALIEPAYTHILDILTRQFSEQMTGAVAAGAMTEADAETITAWMTAGVDEIRTATPPYPTPGPVPLPAATDYTQAIQAVIETNIYGSDPAQMVVTHAYRTLYGKGYDALDPADVAPSVTIPTLITCGTKDFNTPCGDGSAGSGVVALADSFSPGVARFVELPNMVHILRDVGDADVPNLADQLAYPFSSALSAEFGTFVAGVREGK